MPAFVQPAKCVCYGLSTLIVLFASWSNAGQGERTSPRVEPDRRELVDRLLWQRVGQQSVPLINAWEIADQTYRPSERELETTIFGRFVSSQHANEVLRFCLELELHDLDRACHLTSAQKAKLQLLGQGDIKRYFDRYEQLKARSINDGRPLFGILQDAVKLRLALESGLFNQHSLLFKGLGSTLTPAQIQQRDRFRESVRQAAFEQIVARISTWETVREDQRQAFETLFLARTRLPANAGSYDRFLYLMQLQHLPKQTLKTALSEVQIMALHAQIAEADGVKPQMVYLGYFPELDSLPAVH